ncbi:MAG: DUF1127 domain-containing protein [Pseudomonadota bacterium]
MYNAAKTLPKDKRWPNAIGRTLADLRSATTLLGNWIWNRDAKKRTGGRFLSRLQVNARGDQRAIEELRHMSDHELFDVGLSRSDLTAEGLAIAGAKRALRQDLIASELSERAKQREVVKNGN